mgnify:FL=1
MLRTTKNMKEKYEKIQNLLFTLIPEKWESIYLYASVGNDEKQKGEMFFYYIPKSIIKKKPINVYEVPQRFNINEEQYLEIVKELYSWIKKLRQDFIDTEQELWNSLTISIANFKFRVEFDYDELPSNEKQNNDKNIIWRYKYLKIGGEKKEERKVLEEYFSHKDISKKELYETGLYLKTENNNIMFDKEERKAPEKFIKDDKIDNKNIKKNQILKND